MRTISQIMFCIGIVAVLAFSLNYGIKKSAQVECYKWQDQAQEFPLFYLTQAQADQCKALNISIDAPVK